MSLKRNKIKYTPQISLTDDGHLKYFKWRQLILRVGNLSNAIYLVDYFLDYVYFVAFEVDWMENSNQSLKQIKCIFIF